MVTQIVRAAGVEQRPVDVSAMRDQVRIAKSLLKRLAARDVNDLLACDGIHHYQPLNHQCALF